MDCPAARDSSLSPRNRRESHGGVKNVKNVHDMSWKGWGRYHSIPIKLSSVCIVSVHNLICLHTLLGNRWGLSIEIFMCLATAIDVSRFQPNIPRHQS